MADIFVSYTSSDRDWAFWIAKELESLQHTPHVHEWEISGGDDIMTWMEERHDAADHVLCVISKTYLTKSYSNWERRAAQWAVQNARPRFVLPVFIENCQAPNLLAHFKRCDLYGVAEDEARKLLGDFLAPAAKPDGPVRFPGGLASKPSPSTPSDVASFPGKRQALTNIPIAVPLHFLGRDEDLTNIRDALKRNRGRVAITALHGLRGVGKTALAAAYAEQHRLDYRATWWIRAETDSTMRADLVGLGVRLGWVRAEEKDEPALATMMERLCHQGEGILLIFDNASNADELRPYLPRVGAAQIIITSSAPSWSDLASRVEIEVWPKATGADYLIARTAYKEQREAALTLSEALGGLPLAHQQAAAFCERTGVSLADYRMKFETAPTKLLDAEQDASLEYYNRRTVARTFALAIEEATKLHPAAEPLIVYAALLAPEPIPLFLFSDGREKFDEPLASALAGDAFDEAVAALLAFALVDREIIPDERIPTITADSIRMHRLVRRVAAARREGDALKLAKTNLINALAAVYPLGVYDTPSTWPRARRLDPLIVAILDNDSDLPEGAGERAAYLLNELESYRHGALAAHAEARKLAERALRIRQKLFGANDPSVAMSLNNLGALADSQGDLMSAQSYYQRALAINITALGPYHPHTATNLNNLGYLLEKRGDLVGASLFSKRALEIREKVLGLNHPDTAGSINNLGHLLQLQGDFVGARRYYKRALAICEKVLGPDHPDTAASLNNLGFLLSETGNFAKAQPYYKRALAICEKALGSDHPNTAESLENLGSLLQKQGDLEGARSHHERALVIFESVLGPDHPDTVRSLNNFGQLLFQQGEPAEARLFFERALATCKKTLGLKHSTTQAVARNTAVILEALGCKKEFRALCKQFGIKRAKITS